MLPAVFSVSIFCWYQICWIFWYFSRYCCTVNFGGNTFLSFCGNSFFEKFCGNSFFSSKGGRSVQRGGRGPPFLGKRGLAPFFLKGSRQFFDTENTDRVFLRYGIGNTGEIPTEYQPKIPNWYTTLQIMCLYFLGRYLLEVSVSFQL